MKYFSINDLPLNDEMINFWNNNGYLVIENFNTDKECDELMERSSSVSYTHLTLPTKA